MNEGTEGPEYCLELVFKGLSSETSLATKGYSEGFAMVNEFGHIIILLLCVSLLIMYLFCLPFAMCSQVHWEYI